MIMFYANGRYAICETKDKITTGSVGLEVIFSFDETWDGLGKHAVFRGSGAARDMAIVQNRCTVPPEVLTAAGGHLQIGVYGSRTEGEQGSEELVQATPTIWADAGLIESGAEKANIPSTPQTAELVDQILQAVSDAKDAAEDAAEDAEDAKEAAEAAEAEVAKVAWVTYNVTSSADIEALYQAGKIVFCKYGNKVYTLTYRATTTNHTFTCVYGSTAYSIVCSSNNWINGSREIPAAATSAPQDLAASAAVGTSAKYAKEDHKHKMPSATDVGAIAAPGGGTTGQVLKKTDDGVEWANESGGGGTTEVFWATYGTTTTTDMKAAKAAGKIVLVAVTQDYNDYALQLYEVADDDSCEFSGVTGAYVAHIEVTAPDDWGSLSLIEYAQKADVPSPQTSGTPADLGTAARGSSDDYARADHVHKKPSASDIGAYVKPSGGIPKTDLASEVQTSLGKADTALQQHQDISGKVDVSQGIANAGKFLIVGDDGNITLETLINAEEVAF